MILALLLALVSLLVLLLALLLVVRLGVIVIRVEGQSMLPTLESGQRVLALRPWLAGHGRRGQIVIVKKLEGALLRDVPITTLYVKRIVALEGETYATDLPRRSPTPEVRVPRVWHIPAGHLFVCGDNREMSADSRNWGPLPVSDVCGVVLRRVGSQDTLKQKEER